MHRTVRTVRTDYDRPIQVGNVGMDARIVRAVVMQMPNNDDAIQLTASQAMDLASALLEIVKAVRED